MQISKCKINYTLKLHRIYFYLTLGECCFIFLRLLRCFSSPGTLPAAHPRERHKLKYLLMRSLNLSDLKVLCRTGGCGRGPRFFIGGVAPFGNLRIKGCLVPPRSVSHTYRVLHRSSVPRHPPYALTKTCY